LLNSFSFNFLLSTLFQTSVCFQQYKGHGLNEAEIHRYFIKYFCFHQTKKQRSPATFPFFTIRQSHHRNSTWELAKGQSPMVPALCQSSFTSTTANISVALPPGSSLAPMANLAAIPAS